MTDRTVRSLQCDHCGKELVQHTSYPAIYSIAINTIDTNINNTGFEFPVFIYPPFVGTLHFCNKRCLGEWSIGT